MAGSTPGSSTRWRLAALVLLAALASGCRTNHPEHEGYWIRSYYPGGRAESSPAPYAAEYVLIARAPAPGVDFAAGANTPEGPGSEVLARDLAAGADLGFLLEEDVLFALTGPEHTELEPGRYCWHIRPGTGPSMATIRTRSFVKLVFGVVVVGALIGGMVSASGSIAGGLLPY